MELQTFTMLSLTKLTHILVIYLPSPLTLNCVIFTWVQGECKDPTIGTSVKTLWKKYAHCCETG